MPVPERPAVPDVEIRASVRARELRFRARPEVSTHAETEPAGEHASGSDRTNLPAQVAAGVTYHDIQLDFRIAARLTAPPPGSGLPPEPRPDSPSRPAPEPRPPAQPAPKPRPRSPTRPAPGPGPQPPAER
ncbi:hypothetical protein AB0C27_18145 [Nonomuraea sp. NPDC048882]|uniref:hypothetical protein n=1 Tax=unclassified Nonomuraea TaxID=2593643 RepID=UPI0033C4675F